MRVLDALAVVLIQSHSCRQVVPPNLLKVKADADKNAARLGSLACFGHDFDWGAGADRPAVPLDESVILEVHVPTFTAHLVRSRRWCVASMPLAATMNMMFYTARCKAQQLIHGFVLLFM